MPLWLTIPLLLILTFWLSRCFLVVVERGRCGGLCAVPLGVLLLVFSDLPDMAAWLAGIGQTVLEETAIPGSSLGIAVLAAGIFAVVLASLYVVAALIRRWRREKQDPAPPTAVSGPFTAPDEDWDFSGGDS